YRHHADRCSTVTADLERAAERSERYYDRARFNIISKAIARNRRLILAPGTEHLHGRPTWHAGLRGYPHDRNALAPFRYYAKSGFDIVDLDCLVDAVSEQDLIIGTGSPTSSKIAREVMSSSGYNNLHYKIEEIGGP